MADLSSLSLSDLVAAIKERCSTPGDLATITAKLDSIMSNACSNAAADSRDFAATREEVQETKAALFNRIGESERYASQNKDALSNEHVNLGDKVQHGIAKSADYFYGTRGDIQESKYQLHDNIVRQGTDIAKGFGITEKSISDAAREVSATVEGASRSVTGDVHHIEDLLRDMSRDNAACCCETQKEILKGNNSIERGIERSERWMEREFRDRMDHARDDIRDFRAEQGLAFAAVAKAQAECCCETKLLIKDTANEAEKTATANFNGLNMQAVQNYNSLTAQIGALSREMEKGFCALNTKDLERDLAVKQNALLTAQAEISNLKQTSALIEALSRKGHG